jgi:hypothetical protein
MLLPLISPPSLSFSLFLKSPLLAHRPRSRRQSMIRSPLPVHAPVSTIHYEMILGGNDDSLGTGRPRRGAPESRAWGTTIRWHRWPACGRASPNPSHHSAPINRPEEHGRRLFFRFGKKILAELMPSGSNFRAFLSSDQMAKFISLLVSCQKIYLKKMACIWHVIYALKNYIGIFRVH